MNTTSVTLDITYSLFIDIIYNTIQTHSSIGYINLDEFKQELNKNFYLQGGCQLGKENIWSLQNYGSVQIALSELCLLHRQ